jgi:predicted GNAT family acetyltransferase
MAQIANTESLYDFGIFGSHSWDGESSSGISEGFFFIMFKGGKPVSYVIYNKLNEGAHIIHHAFTVPHERRKGYMEGLLRYSLPQIGENEYTVLHRAPMEKEMAHLWRTKFGIDVQKISMLKHWFRFNKS